MDKKFDFESLFDMNKDKDLYDDCIRILGQISEANQIVSAVQYLYMVDRIMPETIVSKDFITALLERAPLLQGQKGTGIDNLRVYIRTYKNNEWEHNRREYVRMRARILANPSAYASFRMPEDEEEFAHIKFFLKKCGIDLIFHGDIGFDGVSHRNSRLYQFTASPEVIADVLQMVLTEFGAEALTDISYRSERFDKNDLTLKQTINYAGYDKQL